MDDLFQDPVPTPTRDPAVQVHINRSTIFHAVYIRVNGHVSATSFSTGELSPSDQGAAEEVLRWYRGEAKASILGVQFSRRYAVIEMGTGYVWWSGYAQDPEYACIEAQRATLEETCSFVPCFNDGSATYAVYEINALLDTEDGQDKDTIAAVTACPLSGFYRILP
jgi:hypothetical protein